MKEAWGMNIELETHEAIIVLGRITDAALVASQKAARSRGDEREMLDVTSKVLQRVATRIVDALYPDHAEVPA
jgi:hypothetical protein